MLGMLYSRLPMWPRMMARLRRPHYSRQRKGPRPARTPSSQRTWLTGSERVQPWAITVVKYQRVTRQPATTAPRIMLGLSPLMNRRRQRPPFAIKRSILCGPRRRWPCMWELLPRWIKQTFQQPSERDALELRGLCLPRQRIHCTRKVTSSGSRIKAHPWSGHTTYWGQLLWTGFD